MPSQSSKILETSIQISHFRSRMSFRSSYMPNSFTLQITHNLCLTWFLLVILKVVLGYVQNLGILMQYIPRMISHFPTSILWSIIQQDMRCFHSWLVSQVIIKFGLLLKINIRLHSLHYRGISITRPWHQDLRMLTPYQRAMTYVFHDMVWCMIMQRICWQSIELRINIGKCQRVFKILIKHNIRLNPKKCAFGVTSCNIIGFIISKRGIEVDPKKVNAITSMSSPHDVKSLRSLYDKIQAIRRFIAQFSNKCRPFNDILNTGIYFEWCESCE